MRFLCLNCSDLLNFLRSLGIIVITTEKSFLLSSSRQKSPFFAVLMYALYGHPRHFKFKQKYQQWTRVSRLSFRFYNYELKYGLYSVHLS